METIFSDALDAIEPCVLNIPDGIGFPTITNIVVSANLGEMVKHAPYLAATCVATQYNHNRFPSTNTCIINPKGTVMMFPSKGAVVIIGTKTFAQTKMVFQVWRNLFYGIPDEIIQIPTIYNIVGNIVIPAEDQQINVALIHAENQGCSRYFPLNFPGDTLSLYRIPEAVEALEQRIELEQLIADNKLADRGFNVHLALGGKSATAVIFEGGYGKLPRINVMGVKSPCAFYRTWSWLLTYLRRYLRPKRPFHTGSLGVIREQERKQALQEYNTRLTQNGRNLSFIDRDYNSQVILGMREIEGDIVFVGQGDIDF